MGVLEGSNNPFPSVLLEEVDDASVPTPAAGFHRLFMDDADSLPKTKDSSGTVTPVDSGGGGGNDFSAFALERAVTLQDYVAAYDASAADERGIPIPELGHGGRAWALICESDFTEALAPANGVYCGRGMTVNAGSGGSPAAGGATDGTTIGSVILSTGTSTSGRSGINVVSDTVRFGTGQARCWARFKIPTLSDGTNTFTVRCGFGNGLAGDPTDGAFFRYTHSVNGGEWQAVTRSNGTETATDTNVAADTGYHRFEIEMNAAGTSCVFKIDGTTVATNTTNIPTGAGRECEPSPPYIVKSAGGTARTIEIDAYRAEVEMTTPR